MGRVFEKRKYKMFARYDKMAKGFTRIGKEIAIAIKLGGGDPAGNSRLRVAIQNAKGLNMPKVNIDAAIKRATSKDSTNLEEIVYEGKGLYGIAILIECATDNPTRTVANVRMNFNKYGGELGKTGSLDYLFDRKGVFRIKKGDVSLEDLELELIDFGADEIDVIMCCPSPENRTTKYDDSSTTLNLALRAIDLMSDHNNHNGGSAAQLLTLVKD